VVIVIILTLLFLLYVSAGSVGGAFYDDEQFVQPVKLFIGDYLHRHVCYHVASMPSTTQ